MKQALNWYLVKKYLRFDKTQPFIAVSAILAFLGVSVGLMVLIVTMAIMNGMMKEFERKLSVMNYPITILPFDGSNIIKNDLDNLKSKFSNLKFSPYIYSQVVLKRGQKFDGGIIFGINFEDEIAVNSIVADALKNTLPLEEFDILAGRGIKEALILDKGDKMTVVFTRGDPSGFTLIPKMKRFTFQEEFSSGLINYDKAYMFTPMSGLAKTLGYKDGTYDGVHVYSSEPIKDIELIRDLLPPNLRAIGWWQQNGNFFSAFELEKRALFIVLMLITLVASLNIISSLLMTIMNRRQEIALLLSLGTKASEIKKTFFGLGMIIGCSGVVFGILLGMVTIFVLGSFDIISLPADVYGSSKLPLDLSVKDFTLTVVGALVIVALSSYYPTKKATQVDILGTLRNE
ncbi:MAG: ABC transporter permease [Campylobacteraceae bacterium]|jgi:putative ABC transport system permease protein|nr:ABC transporter permease [Campylobacteraceae bacterium]